MTISYRILTLSLGIWLAGLLPISGAGAAPGASQWVTTDHTQVRLVSASKTAGQSQRLRIGVQFRLKPDWKIYWRSPGDAGFPPQIDWSASDNLSDAQMAWPVPQRFSVLGLETLGYKDEVILPVHVRPASRDGGVRLQADLRYLTCNDICIPYDTQLTLDLPAGPQEPSDFAHLISRYQSLVPGDSLRQGFHVTEFTTQESGNKAVIQIALKSRQPLQAADVFLEGPRELAYGKPEFRYGTDRRSAVIEVPAEGLSYLKDKTGPTLQGRPFTVTLVDGERAAEQSLILGQALSPSKTPWPAPPAQSTSSLLVILAIAVAGGLILNLMPCVLPVLSIKVLGVVGHGGGENRFVRLSFLASAAGIVASFLVLAGVLSALKLSGMAIGWGMQFQYSWFLIAMVLLVVLFACNLWGFFEVRLPRAVADLGAPAGGDKPLSSHFLQGALATLLATPCSAPFVGTAIGFALARGTGEIFAIFAAMGAGLALPFLIFATFPSLITRLPRPGAWMGRLRFALGFALIATAAWLISVLAQSVGDRGAGIVMAIMVTIIGLLYFARKSAARSGIGRANWLTIAALALLAFIAPAKLAPSDPPPMTAAKGAIKWQSIDLDQIPGLVQRGHTVLVDVTADWCITCKVNKALVFQDGPVAELMARPKFIALQADWTRPDPGISAYLAGFQRYGIPFNAVYGPNSPDGIALPELLTKDAVISALGLASGDTTLANRNN